LDAAIRDVDVEDDDEEDEQQQDKSERITWETEMTVAEWQDLSFTLVYIAAWPIRACREALG
jgi:hypothetical protein